MRPAGTLLGLAGGGRTAALLALLCIGLLLGYWSARILTSLLRRGGGRFDPWVAVFEGDEDRARAVAARLARAGVAARVEPDPRTSGIVAVVVLRRDARRALDSVAGEGPDSAS